jgi:hypothetical protein
MTQVCRRLILVAILLSLAAPSAGASDPVFFPVVVRDGTIQNAEFTKKEPAVAAVLFVN